MYELETTDFALSGKGIHLLRSGYNYKTIEYGEVDKAAIYKSTEIKNVLLSQIIGIALLAFSILQTLHVISLFNNPKVYHIDIETIVLPVLPAIVGGYLVIISLKRGLILSVESEKKKYKLRLRDFVKHNKIGDVKNILSKNLTYRFSIQNET